MIKKNKSSKKKNNNYLKLFVLIFQRFILEHFKELVGWFFIALAAFIGVSFLSDGGIITSKIKDFFYHIFGWGSFPVFVLLFYYGIFLLKKSDSFKLFKVSFALIFFLLVIVFYLHFIFREGGVLGDFILGFSRFVGNLGLFSFSLFLLGFSLWLIYEDKFFYFLGLVFKKSEKIVENKILGPKVVKPEAIKTVKKETKTLNIDIAQPIKNNNLKKRKIVHRGPWKLPPLDLLIQAKEEVVAPDIKTTSEIIKKTLENFGIASEIVEVEIGPAVTRFALKPGEGVKLSKILSLQNDIALSLGTSSLYIETPIPGKAVIGIEVPNQKSAVVRLGNLLREKEFIESQSLFLFPLGRKITGEVAFADLAKMPHLLIAGTTGSGKSIFIHNLLISLLMKNTPETLNLTLIDPKRVELINYSKLPHLIIDPIVEIKKSLSLFNWLIQEMEERYKLLEESQSRDIDSYNKKQIQKKGKLIPRIVLVIDELADLMISYGSSLEAMIIRLSQMARATGIHLVLATQRPSVDIITGLIKANIPNRICFKVASNVDSRTVLDMGGAEKLIGSGDGLFISTFSHRPLRIKSSLVTEKEIQNIVEFWRKQTETIPDFEKEQIDLEEIERKIIASEDSEDEDLLNQAIEIVIQSGKASTSLLQRRLKIGYARAARILDLMEEKGIIGPQEGSKPRKILIDKDYFKYSNNNGEAKQIEE